MTYMPFYGPHKNIVDLADKIIATEGKMDGEISDTTNLYYSMKLISEIDRLYRCMYYYGGSSVIASELKDHILKLQKALGLLNEEKSLTTYFSDISGDPEHPYVKLLTDCRDRGMPLETAIRVVSSMVGIPPYQLKLFIENENVDYPSIDDATPEYLKGASDGATLGDDAVAKLLRDSNSIEASMANGVQERLTSDPSAYFNNKHSGTRLARTNFSNLSEVENSKVGSYNYSGSDSHVNRNKQSTGLNNYIAGVLSSRNFSQDELDFLKLNTKVVQFSALLGKILKTIDPNTITAEKFLVLVKNSEADKLADSLNNYVKKINVKEVLGDNL